MDKLYPLKFEPIFKDKLWGGQKMKSVLDMDFKSLPNCGEAWLLSGVEGNQSIVSNGFLEGNELNELVEVYMDNLVGGHAYNQYGNEFPILVKIIDANAWLSIQVHPDDNLARKRHNGSGKTEMWYIMGADEGSQLISGFNKKTNEEVYLQHLENNTLEEIMNFEKVKKGDVFYIPSGRVHALGPGILLTEIQQTSDITYRIYDWERIDASGMMRELHTELALEAIDFKVHKNYKSPYVLQANKTVNLVESAHFTTNILQLDKPIRKDYSELDSFVIYVCTQGSLILENNSIKTIVSSGEAVLIPAELEHITLFPDHKVSLLESYILPK